MKYTVNFSVNSIYSCIVEAESEEEAKNIVNIKHIEDILLIENKVLEIDTSMTSTDKCEVISVEIHEDNL